MARANPDFGRRLALHLQGDQECGDLRFARPAFQQHAHGLVSFLARKIGARGNAMQIRQERHDVRYSENSPL